MKLEGKAQLKGGVLMPTHVTTQVHIRRLKSMADFGKSVEEGQKIAEQVEIKSLGAYGLLGRHDVMFI